MSQLVLITGISGFIANHIAAGLLREGYRVRGTVRSLRRSDAVRKALDSAGVDGASVEFVEADLNTDAGWREAINGAAFVQHVASPFPINQPRGREDLVPAARDGALRVLRAALEVNVERIVFTSSMVAMMYRANRPATFTVREDDWTDPDWKPATPYIISKTRAEKVMWDNVRDAGAKDRVAVVNPGFVLGPSLGPGIGTSLEVIRLIMRGAYPAVPPISFPVVDVRDLAALHIAAMRNPAAGGRRLMATGGTLSMAQMGQIIRDAFPQVGRKAPTSELPAWAVRMLANFDRSLGTVMADLGAAPVPDSDYVRALTQVIFRAPDEAVRASAESLIRERLV